MTTPTELKNKRIILSDLNPISLICELADSFEERFTEGEAKRILFQKSNRLILSVLMQNQTMSQLEIIKAAKLKSPTVSVTLKRLEKGGYVLKHTDETDHRSVKVMLTEKGREAGKTLLERIDFEERNSLDTLTDYEYRQLMNLLLKIRSNMQK